MSKCYIRLKMYRDAERQLKSSLEDQDMLLTRQYLAKVYLQMDQPKMALRVYDAAIQAHPYASAPHVSKARVYELLNDFENSNRVFKEVLQHDECNIEVMSCLAANYFQRDQFDIAERYFRRILQVNGKESCELWNNIGLCGFFSQQFQTSISCFERALSLATNDAETADIWFNISHIAIHVGDFSLCRESLALATTYNPSHGEAWNNLAVVEYIATKNENLAKTYFKTSTGPKSNNHEPFYNLAVVELAQGNIELCVENIDKSLGLTPNHELSQKLKNQLEELLI
ncbi:TPR-like protein [Rhizoclosmatium globosum]|uniref:TPR-like protein n=1 Tax=Rhizoclosmatium globosum TaxID=329046 RepID=A0A1Y2CZQ6_9FUNG|nr:TPR-like protein [Rhizoclosmatium globosum]|eukprot:ORY52480.1 TPR-like protein [Rhizoclosmatium globosum]